MDECISLGAFRTLLRYNRDRGDLTPGQSPESPTEPAPDPLFQASQLTMLRHMNNVINHLPVPHQLMDFSTFPSPQASQ